LRVPAAHQAKPSFIAPPDNILSAPDNTSSRKPHFVCLVRSIAD
jgi:hypothetical protein